MRSLVLGLLLPCLHLPAMAQAIFVGSDFLVQFYSTPCDVEELNEFMKEAGEVRRAVVVHEGKRYQACYVMTEKGDFLLADVMGNMGRIDGKRVQPGA